METPQSSRRVTRSQTRAALNSIPTSSMKNEETETVLSRTRNPKPDRSVLIDITNDSPIVGLAMEGLETPSSLAKRRDWKKQTPGSGEALLRGQVKTLLQKVEEEAEHSKLTFEHCPFLHLEGLVNSPTVLLAPTPANTPHLSKLSCGGDIKGVTSIIPSDVEEKFKIDQAVMAIDEVKQEETLDSQKTQSLQFDLSVETEISDSSGCIFPLPKFEEESDCQKKSMEEDDASVWSIQVNTSTQGEDDADEDEDYGEEEDYEEDEGEEWDYDEKRDEGGLVDELCVGLSKISVQEKRITEYLGKHTRFIYNSDDEIEGEEVIESADVSPGILHLKGMPTPKGKHLRFHEEEGEEKD